MFSLITNFVLAENVIAEVIQHIVNGLTDAGLSAIFPGMYAPFTAIKNVAKAMDLVNTVSPDTVSTFLGSIQNPIIDKMWDGTIGKLYSGVSIALYYLIYCSIISYYSPNFNLFLDGAIFPADFTSKMFVFLRYCGLTIAGSIFVFMFVLKAFNHIEEIRDSYSQLIVSFILTAGFICIAPGLCTAVCSITASAYGTMCSMVSEIIENESDDDIALTATKGIQNCVSDSIPLSTEQIDSPSNGIVLLLQLILIICLIIELFKCVIEILKRYVLSNLLWLFSPTVAGCWTSSYTRPILASYFRMFISQMILLVLNVFFIVGFILMISNREAYTILNLFIAIAWLQIGNSTERFLANIGMNAVSTGGSLANAVGGTVRTMMMASMATSRAKGAVANGLVSIGAKTNDMGMVSSGLALAGKGGGAGQTLATAIQKAGADGIAYNKGVANSLARAHQQGQYSVAAATIGQIKDPVLRQNAIKNMLGSSIAGQVGYGSNMASVSGISKLPSGIDGNNMKNLEYNPNGSISWTSALDMGDGNMKDANFRLDANSNGGLAIEDNNGNTKFLHSDGIEGGLDVGDRIAYDPNENGISTLEAIGGVGVNSLGTDEQDYLASELSAGEYLGNNEWSMLNEDGERIGSYNSRNGSFHYRGNSNNVSADVFETARLSDDETNVSIQSLGQHLGYKNVEITSRSNDGFKFTAEEYSPKIGEYGSRKEYVATNLVTHTMPSSTGVKTLDLGRDGYYGIVKQEVLGENQKKVTIDPSKLKD